MRGKDILDLDGDGNARITPAYAGKSSINARVLHRGWDHPRLCGEKHPQRVGPNGELGSPPPMRGKAARAADRRKRGGITPAYAGKSQHSFRDGSTPQDHPRLCGEKYTPPKSEKQAQGSPPPMRGKGSC